MGHEQFKNVAGGIQSLVVSIGILVGAGWTLVTFWSLGSAQKASAELAQIAVHQQPGFATAIDAKSSPRQTDGSYELIISLQVRNDGGKNIALDLGASYVSVAKLKVDDIGANFATEGTILRLSPALLTTKGVERQPARYLRIGDLRHLAFVTSVPTAGTYLIQAEVPYGGADLKDGQFVDSRDERILAVEQKIISVPAMPGDELPTTPTGRVR